MANVVDEVSLELPNRPGQLAALTETLGKAGVNIQSMSAATAGRSGTIRMLFSPKDTAKARRALQAAGYRLGRSSTRKVVTVTLGDKPGALARAARKLANARINVDSVYIAGATRRRVTAALGVGKNATKAKRALG